MTDKRIEEWNVCFVCMYVCVYHTTYDCFKRFESYFSQYFFFFSFIYFSYDGVSHSSQIHSLSRLNSLKTTRRGRCLTALKPIIQNMNRVRSGSDFYECK